MADGEEKGGEGGDFYTVLGLDKECSSGDLKNAYRKLAMRWHPDRCSATGSAQVVDHAKNKFQEIQEAYSVLSDGNKRLMYDVGFYQSDDDENGMGDFLVEMAAMMNKHKPDQGKNVQESFKELQDLFMDMFHSEDDVRGSGGTNNAVPTTTSTNRNKTPLRTASLPANLASMPRGTSTATLKRDCCADMASGAGGRARTAPPASGFADPFTSSTGSSFCFGANSGGRGGLGTDGRSSGLPLGGGGGGGRSRRNGRRHKVSSRQDVSSWDSGGGVSAS